MSLVVLASDYVGFKALEWLVSRKEPLAFVGLDERDRGGFNADIRALLSRSASGCVLLTEADLLHDSILADIERAEPDLGVLAWWPRLVKGRLLSAPRGGWLNFHPALLPWNRGKHPNFWCLAEDTPAGVSLHFADEGVDTGDVVAQAALDVGWEDTGASVHRRTLDLIIELFRLNFDSIRAGEAVRIPQDPDAGTFHRAAELEGASRIDLDAPTTARRLFNVIRARMFPPHPTASFGDGGRTYSVEIIIREQKASPHE